MRSKSLHAYSYAQVLMEWKRGAWKKILPGFLAVVLSGTSTLACARETAPLETLLWPIECELNKNCFIQNYMDADRSPSVSDYQCGRSTYDGHTGTDIRLTDLTAMEKGVVVRAAASGKVFATRDGVKDEYLTEASRSRLNKIGLGNAVIVNHQNGWQTVYAHLKQGSVAVKSGDTVRAGQKLGSVGLSGLTEFPHLHFGVTHKGKAIDPFTGQTASKCGVDGHSLWARTIPYQTSQILDIGLSPTLPVSSQEIESTGFKDGKLTQSSKQIVGWVRLINTRPADRITLQFLTPAGEGKPQSLTLPKNPKAVQFYTLVRRREAESWANGIYMLKVKVMRGGTILVQDAIRVDLTNNQVDSALDRGS